MKSRRTFLKLVGVGGVGLVACGDDDMPTDAGPSLDDANLPDGSDAGSLDAALDTPEPDTGPLVDDGLAPVLSNFHIKDAERSRLYFDSSEPLSGSSVDGFTISGQTTESLVINGVSTDGHYFTVASGFTFWDNNTIRYEGGSDLSDTFGNPLYDFTLEYIANQIPEPASSGIPYYVSTTGHDDDNDGLTPGNAFATPSKAVSVGARVIYIEVGRYTDEQVDIEYGGDPDDPILIQGYKTLTDGVPDPIAPNYWVYGEHGTFDDKTVDDDELVTFVGTDPIRTSASAAWKLQSNTILRNIQVTNYNTGVTCGGVSNVMVDNFVAVDMGGRFGTSAAWKSLYFVNSERVRLKNALMSEGMGAFVRMWGGGGHHLLDNVTYVGDQNHPDYQISLYAGSNCIVRGCLVYIVAGSAQHGYGVKASLVPSEHNLFDGNTSLCTGDGNTGIEWRHSDTRFTVVKNHLFDGGRVAFHSSNASSNNIAENCIARNMTGAVISIVEGYEDGSITQTGGDNNLYRNLTIYNSAQLLYNGSSTMATAEGSGHRFVNLTVHRVERAFSLPIPLNDTNEFINCSFSEVGDLASSHNDPGAVFTSCNWFDNGFEQVPDGSGTTTHDPEFVDADNGDFHLGPSSPLRDIGADTSLVSHDADGVERRAGASSIGAFEG